MRGVRNKSQYQNSKTKTLTQRERRLDVDTPFSIIVGCWIQFLSEFEVPRITLHITCVVQNAMEKSRNTINNNSSSGTTRVKLDEYSSHTLEIHDGVLYTVCIIYVLGAFFCMRLQ